MKKAAITILIAILIGAGFGTWLYFTSDPRPVRIMRSILSSVVIGSLMMLVLYNRQYVTNLIRAQWAKMVVIICLLITAALLGTELTFFLQSLLWKEYPYRTLSGGSIYFLDILIVLVTGIPIYISEEYKGLLQSQLLQQQYRVLQLEQQQTLFELELLRAKVNPHFLYNVHNTIAGLISKDPSKAEELVLLLSRFFRHTLNKNSATFHSINDELEIIKTYLQMQHIRFGKRLSYSIEVSQAIATVPMPSFILQPLVENAIKHGIEASTADGKVAVTIERQQEQLAITIADTGPPFPDEPGQGMGLQMVMNKLKLLYGDNAIMELNNTPQKYVRIILPPRDQNSAGRR